jgi:predicted FMN-binding regulatory protein PaiB
MAAFFESRMTRNTPWTSARVEPHRIAAMMQAVVTIEFRVTDLKAQFKLIKHKDEHRQQGIISGLRTQKDANAQAIADLIQETLDQRSLPMRADEASR